MEPMTAMALSQGVGAGGDIVTGILNYIQTEKANRIGLAVYKEQRKDQLAAQRLAQKNYAEDRNYSRWKDSYERGLQRLATQQNYLKAKNAPLIKR